METLKELYYQYNNSQKYFELGGIPEVEEALKNFYSYMENLDKTHAGELDSLVGGVASSFEMQGWIYSYRHVMEMLIDCGFKTCEPIAQSN